MTGSCQASNDAAPSVALVKKRFESGQQVFLAAIPWQALYKPEVTGQRAKGQCALEMRQAGLSETLPGLQRIGIETSVRQLNAQQQMIFMAMQAQRIIVFIQLGLRLMAVQTVDQGLDPPLRHCL